MYPSEDDRGEGWLLFVLDMVRLHVISRFHKVMSRVGRNEDGLEDGWFSSGGIDSARRRSRYREVRSHRVVVSSREVNLER